MTTANLFTGRTALAVMFAAGAVCSLCGRAIPTGFFLSTLVDQRPVCIACAADCDPPMVEVLANYMRVALARGAAGRE